MRAIEASARLQQLLREREVQLGDGNSVTASALLAWDLFCAAATEPAETPFAYCGAMTRVAEHEDADLLLFEAGVYTSGAGAPRCASSPPAPGRASEGRRALLERLAVLRLVTAGCYGAILLLTALTIIGVSIADTGHGTIVGGWAFCSAGLFAVGRLAHLARRDDR